MENSIITTYIDVRNVRLALDASDIDALIDMLESSMRYATPAQRDVATTIIDFLNANDA